MNAKDKKIQELQEQIESLIKENEDHIDAANELESEVIGLENRIQEIENEAPKGQEEI